MAILGVVAVHSIQYTDNFINPTAQSELFTNLISLGRYGVELFFFLSGWLLTSIYGLTGARLGKQFWVRRTARVYPLWLLFIIVNIARAELTNSGGINNALAANVIKTGFPYNYLGIILLSLTFTLFISASLWNTVIPGGWSIQVEVAHYLAFTLLRNKSISLILRILILINFISAMFILLRPHIVNCPKLFLQLIDSWLRLGLYSSLGYFVIGAFAYLFHNETKKSSDKKNINQNISWPSAAIFLLSFLIIPCPFGSQIEAAGSLIVMILLSLCILKIGNVKILFQILGKYSYFIYFMHFLILDLAEYFLEKIQFSSYCYGSQQLLFLTIFLSVLSASVLFAKISMRYFERPFINLAQKVK
jgi:peptidoglycan/LPS O-acetylase OafA/YrhL